MVFMVSTGFGKCCHVRLAQAAQPVQLVWRGIRFRPERNLFMKETKLFKRKTWHLIITGILALTTLGLSLTLIRTIFDSNAGVEEVSAIVIDYSAIRPIAVLLFMLLAVVHLVQYVISDTKPRLLLIRELIYVLFSLGAAFIILLRGEERRPRGLWPAPSFFLRSSSAASFHSFRRGVNGTSFCWLFR